MIQILLENTHKSSEGTSIQQSPGTQHGLIAEKLGLTSQAITWHAKKLAKEGIIHWEKNGREKFYTLTAAAMQMLQ